MACSIQSKSGAFREENAGKFQELERYIDSVTPGIAADRIRGVLIQILHRAQSIFGYLPVEVQSFVAGKLSLSLSEVYGVISFYSFFTTTPIGHYKISCCTGTACFVKGATKVLEEFKKQLNLHEGQTSEDGRFFLGTLRCVGACSLAPVVMVNEKVYGNMTADKVADVIRDCK